MHLLKNFLSLSFAEIVSKLLTFGAFAYLARLTGPDGFGYIEFASAVLLCAGLIVDQGFGPYGAREIAKAPQSTPALVTEIVAVRFILAIGSYIAVIAFVWLLDGPAIVTRLLLIYGLSLLAMPLLLQWVFQGHDRMRIVAIAQIIRQTVFASLVFMCVRAVTQLWFVAIAELAGVCSTAVYTTWMYRRHFGKYRQKPLSISRRLFREGIPIGMSQMFWVARMFGGTLILGMIASAEDVGFFAGAQRILVALHTFVWLYYFNMLPSMARAWQRSDGGFEILIKQSMCLVTWLGVASGIAWVLLAPAVMTGVYGPAFAPAAMTLRWLSAVCVVAALSGHYRFGLIAAGHQNVEMITAALGAVVALIAISLGYATLGLHGAAVGLVVAEVVVWWSSWWYAIHRLGLNGHVRHLSRPLLAAALAVGFSWSMPFSSWGMRTLTGVSAFAALAFLLDVEVRDHFRQLSASCYHWLRGQPNKDSFAVQPAREDLAP